MPAGANERGKRTDLKNSFIKMREKFLRGVGNRSGFAASNTKCFLLFKKFPTKEKSSFFAIAFGIEHIAQGVADDIDADGGDGEEEGGEDPLPAVILDDDTVIGTRQHVAPGGLRLLYPKAEIGE